MNTFSNTFLMAKGETFVSPDHSRLTPNYCRDAEMARLRQEGWTHRALGEKYGLTRGGVCSALWRIASLRARPPLFGLGTHASKVLRFMVDGDITSPDSIAHLSYPDLIDFPNVGVGTAREISAMLWRRGIEIGGLPAKLRVAFEAEYGMIGSKK